MSFIFTGLGVLVRVCSVVCLSGSTGINYMDPLNLPTKNFKHGEDPCNPLYWYPRSIPNYCQYGTHVTPKHPETKTFVPLPSPPKEFIIPAPRILPLPPPILSLPPPTFQIPNTAVPMPPYFHNFPAPAIFYGLQNINSMFNMVPRNQLGMVPGLPGIVSRDGGINIMPFSDAYADILEKHKNKMIRRKLKKLLDKYNYYDNTKEYMHSYW